MEPDLFIWAGACAVIRNEQMNLLTFFVRAPTYTEALGAAYEHALKTYPGSDGYGNHLIHVNTMTAQKAYPEFFT